MRQLANIILTISGNQDEIKFACDSIKEICNTKNEKFKEIAFLFKGLEEDFWEECIEISEISIDGSGEDVALLVQDFEKQFKSFEKFMRKLLKDLAKLLSQTNIEGEFSEYLTSTDEYLSRYSFYSKLGSKVCRIKAEELEEDF